MKEFDPTSGVDSAIVVISRARASDVAFPRQKGWREEE